MLNGVIAATAFLAMTVPAFSEQVRVDSPEELLAIKVNVSGVYYSRTTDDGWREVSSFFKAPGDGLEGDPGFYFYPFTAHTQKFLNEAEGIWTCYRRDRHDATKGKFQFGQAFDEDGKRYIRVNREVQLQKGLSNDEKILVEAGKVVAAIVALYANDPEIYVAGSEGWEKLVGEVHSARAPGARIDMTPTILNGRERWMVDNRFSLTVKRYYNCWVVARYR